MLPANVAHVHITTNTHFPSDSPITATGASSPKYAITYVNGVLTITAPQEAVVSPVENTLAKDSFVPKVRPALSPNGDGIDDILSVEHIEKYPENSLTIIDRTGRLIFQQANYGNVNHTFDGHSNLSGKMPKTGNLFLPAQIPGWERAEKTNRLYFTGLLDYKIISIYAYYKASSKCAFYLYAFYQKYLHFIFPSLKSLMITSTEMVKELVDHPLKFSVSVERPDSKEHEGLKIFNPHYIYQ